MKIRVAILFLSFYILPANAARPLPPLMVVKDYAFERETPECALLLSEPFKVKVIDEKSIELQNSFTGVRGMVRQYASLWNILRNAEEKDWLTFLNKPRDQENSLNIISLGAGLGFELIPLVSYLGGKSRMLVDLEAQGVKAFAVDIDDMINDSFKNKQRYSNKDPQWKKFLSNIFFYQKSIFEVGRDLTLPTKYDFIAVRKPAPDFDSYIMEHANDLLNSGGVVLATTYYDFELKTLINVIKNDKSMELLESGKNPYYPNAGINHDGYYLLARKKDPH